MQRHATLVLHTHKTNRHTHVNTLCTYTFMHTLYSHKRAHVHTCKHTLHACMKANAFIHIYTYVLTDVHARACTHTHTHTHTHRHTHTQTHRHTGTHTHRHTGMQTLRCADTQTHRYTDTQTHRKLHTFKRALYARIPS